MHSHSSRCTSSGSKPYDLPPIDRRPMSEYAPQRPATPVEVDNEIEDVDYNDWEEAAQTTTNEAPEGFETDPMKFDEEDAEFAAWSDSPSTLLTSAGDDLSEVHPRNVHTVGDLRGLVRDSLVGKEVAFCDYLTATLGFPPNQNTDPPARATYLEAGNQEVWAHLWVTLETALRSGKDVVVCHLPAEPPEQFYNAFRKYLLTMLRECCERLRVITEMSARLDLAVAVLEYLWEILEDGDDDAPLADGLARLRNTFGQPPAAEPTSRNSRAWFG